MKHTEYKILAIDLDDTLFSEVEYVTSGFKEVSRLIAEANNINKDDVFNQVMYQFAKYGRTGAFNRAMSYFGVNAPDVPSLVTAYREHKPDINCYLDVKDGLEALRKKFTTVIVTDGLASVQRKKVEALELEMLVDKVVYCMDHNAPKPSTVPYEFVAKELGIDVRDMAIIGDDPYSDMLAASKLGIPSYRVLTGKYFKVADLPEAKPAIYFGSFFMVAKKLLGAY